MWQRWSQTKPTFFEFLITIGVFPLSYKYVLYFCPFWTKLIAGFNLTVCIHSTYSTVNEAFGTSEEWKFKLFNVYIYSQIWLRDLENPEPTQNKSSAPQLWFTVKFIFQILDYILLRLEKRYIENVFFIKIHAPCIFWLEG